MDDVIGANTPITSSLTLYTPSHNTFDTQTEHAPSTPSEPSAYILYPKDKVIFGLQNGPEPMPNTDFKPAYNNTLIHPGTTVKFTLFGSYMTNEKPKQAKLNQTPQFTKNITTVFENFETGQQSPIVFNSQITPPRFIMTI
jgi:hypothetical protein